MMAKRAMPNEREKLLLLLMADKFEWLVVANVLRFNETDHNIALK